MFPNLLALFFFSALENGWPQVLTMTLQQAELNETSLAP